MQRTSQEFSKKPFVFLTVFSIVLFAIALLFSGCSWFGLEKITLKSGGNEVKLTVEIADESEECSQGLMYREKLDSERGMLFVFDEEDEHRFWMKNTLIPLDIIFFNAQREVVDIIADMRPCPTDAKICPVYASSKPAEFALEVNGGFAEENEVKVGDYFVEED